MKGVGIETYSAQEWLVSVWI